MSESFALSLAWFLLLCAGFLLLVGIWTRPAAVSAWFLQLATAKSGGLLAYGVDNFVTIGLFYLTIAPLPDRLSFSWQRNAWQKTDPQIYGFHRRLLQIHLCFIYLFNGATKCLGTGWWDGSNVWQVLV
ncbi:MAG: hypothetical protein ABI540_00230 [Spartobacteria bacterium]